MGRYVIDAKKGLLGSTQEIVECQICMYTTTISDKMVLWLQRPDEHIRFSMAEILPRIITWELSAEDVIKQWGRTTSQIPLSYKSILAIGELTRRKCLLNMGQYPSQIYANYIMQLAKMVISGSHNLLRGIIMVSMIPHHDTINNAQHIIIMCHSMVDDNIVRMEMNRWTEKAKTKGSDCPTIVWTFVPYDKLMVFF